MQLKTLCKYRSIWMGVAIVLVMLYHSEIEAPNMLLTMLVRRGYCGADIFVFASGLGMYFSYTRDHAPLAFMKRRLARLAPVYVPFIIGWGICRALVRSFPINAMIGNLLGIQSLTGLGNGFNWYISALLIFYLLTPYLSEWIEKRDKPYAFLLFVGFLMLVTAAFWESGSLILVARLPIFGVGMCFAKLSQDEKNRLTGGLALLLAASTIAGVCLLNACYTDYFQHLASYGLYWYPFILIVPGLCLFISVLAHAGQAFRVTRALFFLLQKLGDYSFEIFLTHIFCFEICTSQRLAGIFPTGYAGTLLMMLLVIPMSLLLHACSVGCQRLANRCTDLIKSRPR